MGTEENIKNDLWNMVKTRVPMSIILLIIVYVGVVFGGSKVYITLTASEKLTEDYVQTLTSVFLVSFAALTVVVILACAFLLFHSRKRGGRDRAGASGTSGTPEELPKGRIDAFIVEQDAPSRDTKFNDINQNVKRTYWVLGVSLTSIVEHERTLQKMAGNEIGIRVCMMNPDIAVDRLCLSSVENNACVLQKLFEEIKSGTVTADNIRERVRGIENCDDLLAIYHVLIDVLHFNDYYATETDYKERIKNSYDNLKRIQGSITRKWERTDLFELRTARSFLPMSLTIADAGEEGGRMVVEFHLPFTQYKVLFEINREDNGELFKVFVDFYGTIWRKAKGANE